LRHAYAFRLYGETHEILKVRRAFHHAGMPVTKTYLRGLGAVG